MPTRVIMNFAIYNTSFWRSRVGSRVYTGVVGNKKSHEKYPRNII